ncbi:aminoalkylphosphonic acid N-acetyltransferase [Pseudovibrio axinellae]|uniref:Aminoalkylphosphonic acid N-acetyltransferase n=1 Tax=Pseudovibrio axinellae TaxID=989403 RepID=A0A165ZQQ2_9HYPH|nr:GNAT family N-acetyltransferase [Pseudovibrio axinellae]KZL20158.1 aminoalkylphosphonic acid N-acetyltransferase [Pseudovibrio axinellae]SEQ22848.1 Acetyltransferase (GNAT) family protein [Pseudovibrio axinellae]
MIFEEIIVEPARKEDAQRLGELVFAMERELWPEGGFDVERFRLVAEDILFDDGSRYWAFLARSQGELLGLITLVEKKAIYAGGRFGEIIEFYVVPSGRCAGVGKTLLNHAMHKGREMGWPYLEVGAPRQPAWKTTLSFYLHNEFREIGPRLEREI